VEPESFQPGTEKIERPTILFVAGLTQSEEYKGLKILLHALQAIKNSIPDVNLLVVGDGDKKNFYESYAKELGLEDSVEFRGKLDRQALAKLYQKANVFTLPSLNESFGMVALEAMACGIPVVASNVGGLPSLVDNDKTGFLIEPGNIAELSEKLTKLLSDKKMAAEFGTAGRKKAIADFNWDFRAAQYDRIYRESLVGETNLSAFTSSAPRTPISEDLTVVVLTYNSASTIRLSLDSLINQENKNFKVLIVDDDSTDETLSIIDAYKINKKLNIDVIRNGAHSISRGRNIGIAAAKTDFMAFLDSDDYADSHWTEAILNTFRTHPEIALISGPLLPTAHEVTGRAIATNDATIRKLFGKGIMLFCTANSAINKKILKPKYFFDEDFIYAEDLEMASRIQRSYKWLFVPEMQIHQTSREDFNHYASQMYRYGRWKIYYSFVARDYRFLDFIPLTIGILSIIAALLWMSWIPLLAIFALSLLEAVFVSIIMPDNFIVSIFTFPAWIVKNCAWSLGVAMAIVTLSTDKKMRTSLLQKRA
jgi:glycosyltransferase involved in cell wall biosynthesis